MFINLSSFYYWFTYPKTTFSLIPHFPSITLRTLQFDIIGQEGM